MRIFAVRGRHRVQLVVRLSSRRKKTTRTMSSSSRISADHAVLHQQQLGSASRRLGNIGDWPSPYTSDDVEVLRAFTACTSSKDIITFNDTNADLGLPRNQCCQNPFSSLKRSSLATSQPSTAIKENKEGAKWVFKEQNFHLLLAVIEGTTSRLEAGVCGSTDVPIFDL